MGDVPQFQGALESRSYLLEIENFTRHGITTKLSKIIIKRYVNYSNQAGISVNTIDYNQSFRSIFNNTMLFR